MCRRQNVVSVIIVSMSDLTPRSSDFDDMYPVAKAMQVTIKSPMFFGLQRQLASGSQHVLVEGPLCRQAALAARPSCEQVLLDHGSLTIGCSCLPLSWSCCNREKRLAHREKRGRGAASSRTGHEVNYVTKFDCLRFGVLPNSALRALFG